MKKKITPSLARQLNKKTTKESDTLRPRQETIAFLQLFARNCHVDPKLPEGLQEIIAS